MSVRAALALALAASLAKAAPSQSAGAPAGALPMLPSIARVKIEVRRSAVVVVEDVTLPRGEWSGEPLDLFVAFGAPGAPRAIDAHLVPLGDGELEAGDATMGEAVPIERAPRRPPSAHALLGRDRMAGVVVHLSPEALVKAFAPGKMAALRLRSVLEMPELDPSGGRSVLVRLGASLDTPLTLGRIVVSSRVARAEARLCGPDADPRPLALAPRAASAERGLAPVLAIRHASDDLCVRVF